MNSVDRAAGWSFKIIDFISALILFPLIFIFAIVIALQQALKSK